MAWLQVTRVAADWGLPAVEPCSPLMGPPVLGACDEHRLGSLAAPAGGRGSRHNVRCRLARHAGILRLAGIPTLTPAFCCWLWFWLPGTPHPSKPCQLVQCSQMFSSGHTVDNKHPRQAAQLRLLPPHMHCNPWHHQSAPSVSHGRRYDYDGAFSGSASIGPDGQPRLLFTGVSQYAEDGFYYQVLEVLIFKGPDTDPHWPHVSLLDHF